MSDCQGLQGCSRDFSGSSDCKQSACNVGGPGSIPGLGRSLVEGNGNPLQYSCMEKSHGWKCLAGYSPQGCKESLTTEWLHFRAVLGYRVTASGHQASLGGDESVLGLLVMIVHLSEYSKNHRSVHFKGVNFMICEVYLQISIYSKLHLRVLLPESNTGSLPPM